ncbi:MAG: hypothetical protein HOE90_02185 [Bacteriovoracaceae bacterium]|jgi:3-oxoacyl-(acyl-carrier-protein) synthase|nr:hypothetical protein [Bacteriovoracaceae bacterium]
MSEPNGIFIKGSGVISTSGFSTEELFLNCLKAKSGIVSGVGFVDGDHLADLTHRFQKKLESGSSANSKILKMSLNAISQALETAGMDSFDPACDGLIVATTSGLIENWEDSLINSIADQSMKANLDDEPLGMYLFALREILGHTGPSLLVTSACAAGGQAISIAGDWIRTGKVKNCLVVGAEVLCQLILNGFRSLKLISEDLCKPFDQNRSGINLAEGAAALLLSSNKVGATAQIMAADFFLDGYHMTSPEPNGEGLEKSIRANLKYSKVSASEVHYAHLHGTASPANDISESNALKSIFGEESLVFVSSTKAIHGHTLAASGILETSLAAYCFVNGHFPQSANTSVVDSKITQNVVLNDPRPLNGDYILKSTLGFGGMNSSVLLGRVRV